MFRMGTKQAPSLGWVDDLFRFSGNGGKTSEQKFGLPTKRCLESDPDSMLPACIEMLAQAYVIGPGRLRGSGA